MDYKNKLNLLNKHALSIKKRFLNMYLKANAGHIGTSLSCADILCFLYFSWMKESDEFILSKGHAAACLYSVLAEKGILTEDDIDTFYKDGTYLPAHPPCGKINGISFATGSLGHGLSLAAGFGLSKKIKNVPSKIFCLTSDGELNEGSIWEAAQFIYHHNLINVIWIIDKNNIQGFGFTKDVLNTISLKDKLLSFGFFVLEVDGHNYHEMLLLEKKVENIPQPIAIIANTTKGKDWSLQNTVDCHYLPFKNEEFLQTIKNIENTHSKQY